MPEEYTSLYMYAVEGVDSNGDPVNALVTARDPAQARAKVKAEYVGVLTRIRTRRVTGNEWEEALRSYGAQYGAPGFGEDSPLEVHKYAIREGKPIFL